MRQSRFANGAVNFAQRVPGWIVLLILGAAVSGGIYFAHLLSSDSVEKMRARLLSYAIESAKNINANQHLLVLRYGNPDSRECRSIVNALKDIETSNPFNGRRMLARTLWIPGHKSPTRSNRVKRKARVNTPSVGHSRRRGASGVIDESRSDAKDASGSSANSTVFAIEGVRNTTSDDQSICTRTQALSEVLRAYKSGEAVVSEVVERGGELAPKSYWLYAYAPIDRDSQTQAKGKPPAKTATFLELSLDVSEVQSSVSTLSTAIIILSLITLSFVGAVKAGIISSNGAAQPATAPTSKKAARRREQKHKSSMTNEPKPNVQKNPTGSPHSSLGTFPKHQPSKKFLHPTSTGSGIGQVRPGHSSHEHGTIKRTSQYKTREDGKPEVSQTPQNKQAATPAEAQVGLSPQHRSPNETTREDMTVQLMGASLAKVSNLRKAMQTATIHYTRGKAFLKEGDVDHAINEFRTASELAPDEPKPLRKLAEIYLLALKEDQKAVVYLEAMAKLNRTSDTGTRACLTPKHIAFLNHALDVLCQRGKELYRDENIEAAKARFEWVLRIDPDHADARKNLDDLRDRAVGATPKSVSEPPVGATSACPGTADSPSGVSQSKGGDESTEPIVHVADDAMIQRIVDGLCAGYRAGDPSALGSENDLSNRIAEKVAAKVQQRIEDEIADRVIEKLDDRLNRIVSRIAEKIFLARY